MLAALYQCCQRRPLSSIPQSGWFADSQPAESACSPRRSFHPAASALLPPHTHPSCLADPSNPVPPLLFLSSFAPLGLWRWASPQWHYCTDCSASSSNGGCSLVNTHVRTGRAALPSSTFCLVILVSNQSLSLYVCIFFFASVVRSGQPSLTMTMQCRGCSVSLKSKAEKQKALSEALG